ncbi:MAG: VOC family protein [Spirochaetaceae bacterium]|nr:VOC family protein [Spirochaetaceae bacterium]MCF7947594.1 VOC family protein [Spirochaetia bacterium]MCF7951462.1 VOC family protein [Spirochaetaceae bacterium]
MDNSIRTNGIEHIGMLVQDTEALAAWYCSLFGASEVSRSKEDMPIIFLSFGRGALIELVPTSENVAEEVRGHIHISLSVNDIAAATEVLSRKGAALERPVFEAYDGSKVAFFRDPEGNLVQLVERITGSSIHAEVFEKGR